MQILPGQALYRHRKHARFIINFKDSFTHAQLLLPDMKALNIFQINLFHIICFMFKCKEIIAPPIFHSLFTPKPENKYSPVPNNSPSPPRLLILGFFVGPLPPLSLINFPDFVLQIFQRLLKRIVLFAKLQGV